MRKLIYIYPSPSTFVDKDIEFLKKSYLVIIPPQDWRNKNLLPFMMIWQFFYFLRHIHSTHATIIMFGGYWSFIPSLLGKIFRKKVFIILGGTDCVSFPSINYGALRKPIMRFFIKCSYSLCSRLLPVHESLIFSENTYYNEDFQYQGLKFFFKKNKTPFITVHNGYDANYWAEKSLEKKANSFITVAAISDHSRFKLKGIDILLKLAIENPLFSFKIIGIRKELFDSYIGKIPENILIYEFLPKERFITYLYESQFYLSLSISEGFPNSLCEAMLCKCIPIGSSVGAISLIIGNTGLIINKRDLNTIPDQIKSYVNSMNDAMKNEKAESARARIIENFPLTKREELLLEIIN